LFLFDNYFRFGDHLLFADHFLFSNQGGRLPSVHFRHLHIHQNEVEGLLLPSGQRLLSGLGENHRMPSFLEESHGYLLVHEVVLCEQDLEVALVCGHGSSRDRGRGRF